LTTVQETFVLQFLAPTTLRKLTRAELIRCVS